MKIKTAFKNNEKIPIKYTADGENINPEIIIEEIPSNAKSLVLIVDDPDAQRVAGITWIHWVVFNIPIKENKVIIKENSIPGTAGIGTSKNKKYFGPSPPKGSGVHHYYFKFYAIDTILNLEEGSTAEKVLKAIEGHIIDKGEIIGVYYR